MDDEKNKPQGAEPGQSNQPAEKPVDQKTQEEAAKERKETGGYQ